MNRRTSETPLGTWLGGNRKGDLRLCYAESSSRGKRPVFLCKRAVRVDVGSKVISASFLKIEGRETFVGTKDRRERETDKRIDR